MQDNEKTQDQLIDELNEMRSKVAESDSVQESLKEEKLRYLEIVDKTSEGIFVIQDGWIKFANKKASEITGYSVEEAVASIAIAAFVHPDDQEMLAQYHARRLQGDESQYQYPFRFIRNDGTVGWVEMNSSLIMWEGRPAALCLMAGITEHKQVEMALRESEQRLEHSLEGGSLGLWDWNLKTGLGVWGDRTIRMLGYEPNELDPHISTWKRAVHPDDWENVSEVLNGHLSGRLPFFEAEYRMRTKSGEWKWIQDRGKVVEYDKEGRPQRMTGTTLDVTERRKAEEELRKSEEKYRRLIENAYDIIYATNPGGRVTFVNPAGLQHIRYSKEELIGRNYLEFIPEEYRGDISRFYSRQFLKQVPDTYYEFPFVIKSGEIRWYGQKTQLLMENGSIIGFQSIARDITEQKRSEEVLRSSEERFRGMFEKHSAVMLLIEPVTGKILNANKAAERFYGYTVAQLLSMFIQDINALPPEEVEATRNLILKEQRNYFIFPHRLANGEVRTVEVHSSPIEQNGVLLLFSIIHDITDRERLEQETTGDGA